MQARKEPQSHIAGVTGSCGTEFMYRTSVGNKQYTNACMQWLLIYSSKTCGHRRQDRPSGLGQ